MLRALGVTRRQVLGLFLGESLLLGLAGTVAGVGLGRLLADWAVGFTGATVSTLYIATAAAPPALTGAHLALACRGRRAAVAAGRGAAGDRGSRGCRPRPPSAAATGSNRASASGRGRWPRPPWSWWPPPGLATARPGRWPSALRLPLGARDHRRRVAAGAGRCSSGWPGRCAQPLRRWLRRRGPARPRAPGLGHPPPVDLGGRPGGQPGDDGRGGGDDRQLPRHGRLLGGPDAAGRPLRRARRAAHGRIGADALARRDRHRAQRIPTSTPSTRSATSTSSTSGNLVVLGAGQFDVVRSHGALLFKAPADGRAALARAIGTDAVVVSETFANRYGVGAGRHDAAADAGGRAAVPGRGRLLRLRRRPRRDGDGPRPPSSRHFGDLPPTSLAVYLRDGADPDAVRQQILDGLRRRAAGLHLHQPRAARRGAAHLRQHLRHHLRARAHRHRRRDARRGGDAAHAGARAAARAGRCCA